MWDEDKLEYGYLLARPIEGGWWHMHFLRGEASYYCELLGRRTNIFAMIQWFAAGAVAKSPRFVLTLDAAGVEHSEALSLDGDWGKRNGADELQADALHFQREIMPLLYDCPKFQSAVNELVKFQRYLRLAPTGTITT